jgi:outer membrane protein assembly factor BamE (lipoprotein component of BamABCDE complex)
MRRSVWAVCLVLVAGVVLGGCYYKRPDIEGNFGKVQIDMTKAQVVALLGEPTKIDSSEMYYIYDDPKDPVRLRFVLDENDLVVEKYYETKRELAKKVEVPGGQLPSVKPLPGEEPRTYPGGPLDRFEKKPVE